MELLSIDDPVTAIAELKKITANTRPGFQTAYGRSMPTASAGHEKFHLVENGLRVKADFKRGLSFATGIGELRDLLRFKAQCSETIVELYAIDEYSSLPKGLRFVRDKPGHASLVVIEDMKTSDLIQKLEEALRQMERIGKFKVKP